MALMYIYYNTLRSRVIGDINVYVACVNKINALQVDFGIKIIPSL